MTIELASAKYLVQSQDEQDVETAAAEQTAPMPQSSSMQQPLRQRSNASNWDGKLTAVCVALFVMGSAGFLWAVLGVFALTQGTPKIQQTRNLSAAMVKQAEAVQQKLLVPQIFLTLIKAGVGAMLALSAIMMIMKRKNSRQFGVNSCYGAIGYHLLSTGLAAWSAISLAGITKEVAQRYGEESARGFLGAYSFGVVIVLSIGLLFWLAIYGCMAVYLNSSNVRNIFGEDQFPERADELARAGQNFATASV